MQLEDLRLYNECLEFEDKVWNKVKEWNYFEKDTMGKQLVRSSDSVSSNIAEGYGRFYYKENKLFCYYSRGSLLETKNWLTKANRRGLINNEEYSAMIEELNNLHKKLNSYINSIGNKN